MNERQLKIKLEWKACRFELEKKKRGRERGNQQNSMPPPPKKKQRTFSSRKDIDSLSLLLARAGACSRARARDQNAPGRGARVCTPACSPRGIEKADRGGRARRRKHRRRRLSSSPGVAELQRHHRRYRRAAAAAGDGRHLISFFDLSTCSPRVSERGLGLHTGHDGNEQKRGARS